MDLLQRRDVIAKKLQQERRCEMGNNDGILWNNAPLADLDSGEHVHIIFNDGVVANFRSGFNGHVLSNLHTVPDFSVNKISFGETATNLD